MRLLPNYRFALLLLLLFGCDKPSTPPGPAGLLTAHPWKLTAILSDPAFPVGASQPYTDLLEGYRNGSNDCVADQRIVFQRDADAEFLVGTYEFRQGKPGCGGPQGLTQGRWSLELGSTPLAMYLIEEKSSPQEPFFAPYCALQELSSRRLVLKIRVSDTQNIYNWTYVFEPE